ncbi:GH25 family lysozyme [Chelativorans sp. Marseille-P2723]|uniref:glycoside hydrolase family 25 protein n=1 Tax=Chelativorans sp. Marseille-P2723 TaxID=2709133 RepID=UPI00156FDA78|nr:GH25 family lysozyme [Chelativorans sp. Marseille-P2723]
MRLLMVLMLTLPLFACAGGSYDFSDLLPASAPEIGPRFDDTKPHAWDGRPPWQYPIHGTDVSKYQGEIDWGALRRSGIAFAFIKATEGGDMIDDFFQRNWMGAHAAGIPRGAYHFFYFCRPAIEQARWFIQHVPRERHALPPVLDMEWNHLSPTCRLRPSPETVRAEMQVFLDTVERHYGKRPIIYTSIDFFDDNGLSHFKGYPFWLRSVAGHPDERYGNHPWIFWQYTGTGVLPGINGNADINVFHGNHEAWQGWLRAYAG